MSVIFSANETIQLAMKIEENGEAFYRGMAKKLNEKEMAALFTDLANEEVKHRDIFQKMIPNVENYEPPESFPGEYYSYLKAYANEHIFTKENTAEVAMNKINSFSEALKFAMDREIDSILYYFEAKNLVPQTQRAALDLIIQEERKHYLRLLRIKNKSS